MILLKSETAGRDAHAAHERIRFNELLNWASKKSIYSQKLLIAEKIELLPKEVASLVEKQLQLAEFGLHFNAEVDSVAISELPSSIRMSELPSLLKGLAELEINDVAASIQKVIEKILARTACRSSVMSGMRLSDTEAQALWEQIRKEPHGAVCPHGRPVMVELSRAEIDKMFFRDGF